MIKRIWAKLTGGQLVWLKDFDGERTLAISRVDAWGTRYAKRYWPFNVLIVDLKDDGTVSNSYVKLWTFHNNVLIVDLKDDGAVSNSYVKLWTFHK